ncbi:jhy protein homolog [Myripristis murdjan]|uniref:jhy protein homolog n=1 Tax=Myripristis murdjan TaxID=586833 RepID=UPI001175F575|nr:jhy protein homolog [Myripristis murdjan]
MDRGLTHGKTHSQLKNEEEEPPSPTQAHGVKLWDPAESDTESLAQERAYQQQLHRRIGCYDQINSKPPQEENADNLQQGDWQDNDADEDGEEDLQVYDSLEVAAHSFVKRNSTPFPAEAPDAHQQMKEREGSRQVPSDDVYSDLRYDPNWRTNLKGACRFNESLRLSVEEEPQNFDNKSEQKHQELAIKGGYTYVVARSSAVVETVHMTGEESEQPYHLHPQHEQASQDVSLTSGGPGPSISSETTQQESKVKDEKSQDYVGENPDSSPKSTEHFEELQKGMFKLKSSKSVPNKQLGKLREDIVERNKITLGRNIAKRGSYLKAHVLKRETPTSVNEVCETQDEMTIAENLEVISDLEVRWLQKTQQLKVMQISKGKKARRKENHNPLQQQRPPAPGVKAERGDCLSPPSAGPATKTQPDPQRTPWQPPPSTAVHPPPQSIHLNINVNTSSGLPPFVQQKGQDAIITLASLHGPRHWSPGSDAHYINLPFTQDPCVPQLSLHDGRFQRVMVPKHAFPSPIRDQGSTAPKCLLICEEENPNQLPNEDQVNQFPEDSPRPPSTTQSQHSGYYTVLPPIGKPLTGQEPELRPGQCVQTSGPIHRSSSDGYLAQMDKQKQLREKISYKAYTLKDYKQLKHDVHLRGLGPDYTAIDKTKMRRQKLYSNAVREQNKNMSRIPFLPAKDPEGSDKTVPRTKALEYAKTIAKPPAHPQPKPKPRQTDQSEGIDALVLKGLDLSQLVMLERLKKRHEAEKQAVASLSKVQAL